MSCTGKASLDWNPKFDIVFEKYEKMKKEAGGKLQEYDNS